jgi:hypothetical protein
MKRNLVPPAIDSLIDHAVEDPYLRARSLRRAGRLLSIGSDAGGPIRPPKDGLTIRALYVD